MSCTSNLILFLNLEIYLIQIKIFGDIKQLKLFLYHVAGIQDMYFTGI